MRRFLLLLGSLSALVLYMLAIATGYADAMSQHFWLIAIFSALLIFCLSFALFHQLWKLLRDVKRHVFGARISQRLVRVFTWVTILPAVFIFAIAAQFITHSINSWFGEETSEALERSMSIAKNTLDNFQQESLQQAIDFAEQAQNGLQRNHDAGTVINKINSQHFSQILLYNSQNKIIAKHSNTDNTLPQPDDDDLPNTPNIDKQNSNIISINNTLYAQSWQRIHTNDAVYLLFLRWPVPQKTVEDVVLIEKAHAKYAELTFNKKSLQTFFVVTLLMSTLLAVVFALLTAVFFARRLVAPLMSLAQATQYVAQGDFTQRAHIYRPDELGMLSARFNRMIEQLQSAQDATTKLHKQQEDARHYLELILTTLSSGVMTLDEMGFLKTFNQSAVRILDYPLHKLVGKALSLWEKEGRKERHVATFIQTLLDNIDNDKQIEHSYDNDERIRILLGRAIAIANGQDTLIVFDDVTQLVSAQKEAAWGEVARRLAHEIKNPLTPIRLSAERLTWKLSEKLEANDSRILQRSTDTIINQVDALQEMVEDFRNYARSSSLKLEETDINELVQDVLVLYEDSTKCCFNVTLETESLYINADKTALRQVLHNLFKNAVEAASEDKNPEVSVSTEKYGENVVVTVTNNGLSFSPDMIHQIFEPYVTTKKTGTGLGLAVVKKIVEEHHGMVIANNNADGCAMLQITLPLLMEK